MRMSSYSLQDRYRKRSNERLAGLAVVMGILFLSFGTGFWIGQIASRQSVSFLKSENVRLTQERDELQNSITGLRAETQTALARYSQLQKTYEEVLPEGPLRDLTQMLKTQLDEGRDPERLAFLIRSARPPKNCTEPEIKRFVATTPAYSGPESAIALADGALIIKGSGISAMNASGKPEAWFDPSQKVTLTFTGEGGVAEEKVGILPMNHSVVVANREYRLTISEGARSFIKVTFDSCDYP
jgi:hypothetical protein